MRNLVLCCVLVIVALVAAEEKYTTKYDDVDLEEILGSDRIFNNYFKCLMERGKCTPDGSELKGIIPDALATECSKCSEAQKKGAERVIRFLIEKKPDQWKELKAKYDPDNVYVTKHKEELERAGIQA